MTPLALKQRKEIIIEIDKFLKSKNLDNLSQKELEYITQSLLVDKLKDELKTEIKKSNTDILKIKNKWLENKNSEFTKTTYLIGLDLFFNWLETRNIDIYNIKALDVDDYISFLKKQDLSNSSLRLRVSAVSSFFSHLQRMDIIEKNYFKGCELPKKKFETKSSDEVPNDDDIKIIIDELYKELNVTGTGCKGKRRQARILLAVITIIIHHALRVGSLADLKIDRDNKFKSKSKESNISGKLQQEVVEKLEELDFNKKIPFANLKTETIKKQFQRFCKRLKVNGKIENVFSLHDIRHYSAVKHYKQYKDIIALQRFLNHKSVSVTQIYLSSLNVEL